MRSVTLCTATLPNGIAWEATLDAHREVWRLWRQLASVAMERGEGVKITIDVADGHVELRTVYAPCGEGHLLCVSHSGSFTYTSEPGAPDLPRVELRPCPWEVCPLSPPSRA